jgi:hypothetical protein
LRVPKGQSADTAPQARTIVRTGASRNSPSFAVALNCGTGSSSLNAEVNALERLQMVRGRNSSYFGSKYHLERKCASVGNLRV